MLAKKFRLSRKQVNAIYRRGKTRNFGSFSIKFLPNRLEFSRFSVIVPKSLLKKTVERNRTRRIIFEELANLNLSGFDCLIRIHRIIPEADLKEAIKKVSII